MNAKTTKFLAVLAVLAMAFAGVAVLAQEQINDADAASVTTSATYATDYASDAGIVNIKLETTAGPKAVVLYKSGMTLAAGNAYYVNADAKITLPNTQWDSGAFVFFVLNGVEVELVPPTETTAWSHTVGTLWVNVASEADGVITLSEAKAGDNAFGADGYFGEKMSAAVWDDSTKVEWKSISGVDSKLALGDDNSVKMKADDRDSSKFLYNTPVLNVLSDCVVYGGDALSTVNYKADDVRITYENYTGSITYQATEDGNLNTIMVKDFTGVVASVAEQDTPKGTFSALKVLSVEAGYVMETATSSCTILDDGVTLEFYEGAILGGGFGYVDEYGDMHFAQGTSTMVVGMDRLKVYAGNNMIGFDGTLLLQNNEVLTFSGNAVISGMIYTTAQVDGQSKTSTLGIVKYEVAASGETPAVVDKADVKFDGLQIVGDGDVTLDASALVLADTSFYVKGKLTVNSILKVAEGAVVKSEGQLSMGRTEDAKPVAIWNAGQVVVPASSYTEGSIDDQLVRVYMNSTEGTGKFFAGSAEYVGTLAVAYGAYIDITGICDVNLTSNNITVQNNLYRYWTMILATKNTTIPLTVDYPNQYPATISLEGKDCSSVETTPKSATFRNVVWETPSEAFIYITAPEVYEVKLVEVIDETTKATDNAVTIKTPVKTGVTFTDQKNRVVVPDENGIVELVFNYKYTIKGATDTSKYKFNDYFKAFDTLTIKSKTEASFTMIRNPSVYVIDGDAAQPAAADCDFAVLQITEGKAAKIIVKISDDDAKKLTDGQDFLYYKVDKDGKEIAVPYVAGAGKTVITGIYSNDEIYFRAADVDFYKFQFGDIKIHVDASTGDTPDESTDAVAGWQVAPAVDAEHADVKDIPTEGWTAVAGITGLDGAYTETTGGVELPIVVAEDSITIKGNVKVGDATTISAASAQKFKITWVKSAGQKTLDPIGASDAGVDITLLADEIITITWDDIDDVRQTMTILGKEYTKGTEYTVSTDLTDVKEADQNITLKLDKIEYAQVQNSTEKDFTVVCGEFTTVVAKGTIEKKAAEVVTTTETQTTSTDAGQGAGDDAPTTTTKDTYTIDLTLQLKGQSVVSWTYTVLDGTDTSKVLVPSTSVVGESATITFPADTAAVPENCIVKITNLSTIYNPYIVKTQPVEHAQLGDYSRVGHMDDRMFVYVSADPSYNVADVLVYYEDPANEGFPDYERGIYYIADKSADGKYWTYFMPAENVVLMPQVQKAFYDVTLVDETGAQIGDKIPVAPGKEAVIEIPVEELMYVVSVEPTPAIADFDFEDGVASFTMPASDVTLKVTYAETEYSKNVLVTVGQEKNGAAINVVLYALDDKEIGSGEVTIEVWYTYIDEFGDLSVDCVEVTLTYEANDQTVAILSDETFIDLLGENYGGAYAITGEYVLGAVEGVLSTTAYIPVEA